ncbi:MAG TPA: hypothetical protein VFM14_19460 [Gemmatimonadales bacterium]|nr:hypothetical protein [Gemmatimonadales bacterium]
MGSKMWRDGALLLLVLVGVSLLFAWLYISRERTFYFADYNAYLDFTTASLEAFRESAGYGLRRLYRSLGEDYNFYFTLPLLPIMELLGESRTSYLLGITLVYHVGFALSLGALAVRLIAGPPHAVFWSVAFLSLAVPTVWAPTLRGYPDLGAAALVALGIAAYDRSLRSTRGAAAAAVAGACFAGAALFRRHYAYAITAAVGAMLVDLALTFVAVRRGPGAASGELRRRGAAMVVAGLAAGFVLLVLGWPFVWRTLHTDFSALYAGYERDLEYSIAFYASMYGIAMCALALTGYRLGWKTGLIKRDLARFVLVFAAVSFAQWVLIVRQTTLHYTTHFSFAVVLGIAALVWSIPERFVGMPRRAAEIAVAAFLMVNMIAGLAPGGILETTKARWFFAAGHPPLVLDGYDGFIRLIEYLRRVTRDDDRIYVAAWSAAVSPRSLERVDRVVQPSNGKRLAFWRSVTAVDSRDRYPLQKLLQSEYVVVPSPPQYHLPPDRQRLVRIVHDLFVNNGEMAADFTALPEQFDLGSPPAWQVGPEVRAADSMPPPRVTVRVYRRNRATSLPAAIRTLAGMEAAVAIRPGAEHDWIALDSAAASEVHQYAEGRYRLTQWMRPEIPTARSEFVHLDPVPDRFTLTGRIHAGHRAATPSVALKGMCMDRDGRLVAGADTEASMVTTAGETFSLTLNGCAEAFLVLSLQVEAGRLTVPPYPLHIDRMELRPRTAS